MSRYIPPTVVRFNCDYPTKMSNHLDVYGTAVFQGPSVRDCERQAELYGWEINANYDICPRHRSGKLKR